MKTNLISLVTASMVCTGMLTQDLCAETITIGKGTGIVWEGMPFNETLRGKMVSSATSPQFGLLSISDNANFCASKNIVTNIAGYEVMSLQGVSGVGLIPRANGNATYVRYNGQNEALQGTIGLPQTAGHSTSEKNITTSPSTVWCLPPQSAWSEQFYDPSGSRVATLAGTWVLVADGTQKSAQVKIPKMFFASLASTADGDRKVQILPPNITLRVSTLECNVNTPTTIDFGSVGRNITANEELALKSVPLVTTCGQASDFINANVNLQFRAISGLYNGETSRLALNQGGGFITGEIDGGVTGSGTCTSTSGVRFDSKEIKLGNITTAQSSKTFSNQLTWRLCSGGASLPTGKVNASAEMLVTFN